MFWGQTLIEFRRTNKARSWPNFRAWHLKTDSKSAFATSLVGSRSPPLTTSFGISAFDMSRGIHHPTLLTSSRMHHFPNNQVQFARTVGLDRAHGLCNARDMATKRWDHTSVVVRDLHRARHDDLRRDAGRGPAGGPRQRARRCPSRHRHDADP